MKIDHTTLHRVLGTGRTKAVRMFLLFSFVVGLTVLVSTFGWTRPWLTNSATAIVAALLVFLVWGTIAEENHTARQLEAMEREQMGDVSEAAGLKSAVRHLSALVEEQRSLLADVEDVCGRDGHGGRLEDGESELIDRVRAHLAKVSA